jgi:hypothetical protein
MKVIAGEWSSIIPINVDALCRRRPELDHSELHRPKPINMDYIQTLLNSKRIPLLAILIHSDFLDCRDFRSQVANIKETLR